MRIAIGSLMHESNTFVATLTTKQDFASYLLCYDADLFSTFASTPSEIGRFLDVLQEHGISIIPTLAANAMAGGPVQQGDFDHLLGDLTTRLRAALPVDGVLLALHGAMSTEQHPDAETEILKAVRHIVGTNVPIAASLDLHGHITPSMLEYADILVGYQNYPHTDMFATGKRTAEYLLAMLAGQLNPTMALHKLPMIVSPVNARTEMQPLQAIVERARAIEADGSVLQVSLFPVQPWLDVPDLGFAVLVLAHDDDQAAQNTAQEIGQLVWDQRGHFEPDLVPLNDAIKMAHAEKSGVTIVGDAGDAPTGGAAADQIEILNALLHLRADQFPRQTYLTLNAPLAAKQAHTQGLGSTITAAVGHHISINDGEPLTITGEVLTLSDGNHFADSMGVTVQMGLSAVLEIGSIRLCVRSIPSMEWDPAMYTSLGLDIRQAGLVFVKSPTHFRASFGALADRIVIADTAGATCPNMRRLHFEHVTRPLYPLDDI